MQRPGDVISIHTAIPTQHHTHMSSEKKQKELAYVNTRKYIENTSYRYI